MKKNFLLSLAVFFLCCVCDAAQWQAEWSDGAKVVNKQDGSCWFDVPASPGHINYLTRSGVSDLAKKKVTLSVRIKPLSGKPVFRSLDTSQGLPPSVRLYIERDMQSEDGRWWSNPASIVLRPDGKTYAITVKVAPGWWSNVYGHTGSTRAGEFFDCVKHARKLGVTFGGGNSFGHGVYVAGGKARCFISQLSTLN